MQIRKENIVGTYAIYLGLECMTLILIGLHFAINLVFSFIPSVNIKWVLLSLLLYGVSSLNTKFTGKFRLSIFNFVIYLISFILLIFVCYLYKNIPLLFVYVLVNFSVMFVDFFAIFCSVD